MRTLAHHIQNARSQPMHVRKQIAFTTAFVGAALVAVLWFGVSLATGAFALNTSGFTPASNVADSGQTTGNTSLLGSVAAAFSGSSAKPAHVDVVNAGVTTSKNAPAPAPAPDRTVIPF